MKRNRYIIAYVLLAFCFIKHPVVGQNRSFTGTVTIHPVRLEQVGDSLYIEMDMVLEDVKMNTSRGADWIPQLVSASCTLNLPRISLKGRDDSWAAKAPATAATCATAASTPPPTITITPTRYSPPGAVRRPGSTAARSCRTPWPLWP